MIEFMDCKFISGYELVTCVCVCVCVLVDLGLYVPVLAILGVIMT